MNVVAGDDESHRPHGERVIAGDAALQPGFLRQIPERGKSGKSNGAEVFDMIGVWQSPQDSNVHSNQRTNLSLLGSIHSEKIAYRKQ